MSLHTHLAIPRVDNLVDGYFAGGFADLSDARLGELIALVVSRPKIARASSFVLHAPLELLARTALLPMVEPPAREAARQRLLWLGAAYREAGEEVPDPAPSSYDQPAEALAAFRAALSAGDAATADAAAAWLAAALTPAELSAALADDIPLGRTTLDPEWSPAPPATQDSIELLDGEPALAAAGVWHAQPTSLPAIISRLATRAAVHQDAHLAKYTHACFDAASADPAAARLYLAAAAYLSSWWAQPRE